MGLTGLVAISFPRSFTTWSNIMCDFHSVIVRNDGTILHLPENSHSAIARHHKLDMGLDAKWYECEWDGLGEMPVYLVQTRGKCEPTQVAYRAAESHYKKLALIMAGDLDPRTTAPFNTDVYMDVRDRYDTLMQNRQLDPIVDAFVAEHGDMATDLAYKLIRRLADGMSLDMSEIAAEEIAEAIENDETRYQQGYEDGQESVYENGDAYTSDDIDYYVEERLGDAKREWEREREDEDGIADAEGYERGYRDAKLGKPPEFEFISGMPSFLF